MKYQKKAFEMTKYAQYFLNVNTKTLVSSQQKEVPDTHNFSMISQIVMVMEKSKKTNHFLLRAPSLRRLFRYRPRIRRPFPYRNRKGMLTCVSGKVILPKIYHLNQRVSRNFFPSNELKATPRALCTIKQSKKP